jgi:HEXXH motif-containing protein
MNATTHRLNSALFGAICGGGGGPEAIRILKASQRSKAVLSIGAVVALARDRGHRHGGLARDAYDLLCETERDTPEAVAAVLDYPTVGAWALRTALELDRGDVAGAEPQRMAAVAAAAAVRAGAPARLPVIPRVDGRVVLPSLGVAALPDGSGPVRFVSDPDGPRLLGPGRPVRIAGPDDAAWSGVPEMFVAHDGLGLALRFDHLDEADDASSSPGLAADWQAKVAAGWRILVGRHRPVATEFIEAITLLAPLPDPAAGTASSTARHAFGAIAMSTPTDPRSVAVTLAHELQHAKLSALMDLFPLVLPGADEGCYVPWRPDPRPIGGVLQGAYAHLAIADFWRREMAVDQSPDELFAAQVEFLRWRDAVGSTAERLLASERLTSLGDRLVGGVLATIESWTDTTPTAARRHAAALAAQHRARWERAHGLVR